MNWPKVMRTRFFVAAQHDMSWIFESGTRNTNFWKIPDYFTATRLQSDWLSTLSDQYELFMINKIVMVYSDFCFKQYVGEKICPKTENILKRIDNKLKDVVISPSSVNSARASSSGSVSENFPLSQPTSAVDPSAGHYASSSGSQGQANPIRMNPYNRHKRAPTDDKCSMFRYTELNEAMRCTKYLWFYKKIASTVSTHGEVMYPQHVAFARKIPLHPKAYVKVQLYSKAKKPIVLSSLTNYTVKSLLAAQESSDACKNYNGYLGFPLPANVPGSDDLEHSMSFYLDYKLKMYVYCTFTRRKVKNNQISVTVDESALQ